MPLPGYHGNRVKNPASWFCAHCSYVPPSQFWKYCENWFLSYVCYRVWPIRGLAWLPWQPDWNDNHFQKVRVMGFVVVYHPCGLAFRKVLKFNVENWAVDHWTPLNVNIRSLSKNFDKLRECSKPTNHDFTVIGISETHLKGKPLEYYNLPGYKMEYVNRVGRKKEGCVYMLMTKLNLKLGKTYGLQTQIWIMFHWNWKAKCKKYFSWGYLQGPHT